MYVGVWEMGEVPNGRVHEHVQVSQGVEVGQDVARGGRRAHRQVVASVEEKVSQSRGRGGGGSVKYDEVEHVRGTQANQGRGTRG